MTRKPATPPSPTALALAIMTTGLLAIQREMDRLAKPPKGAKVNTSEIARLNQSAGACMNTIRRHEASAASASGGYTKAGVIAFLRSASADVRDEVIAETIGGDHEDAPAPRRSVLS